MNCPNPKCQATDQPSPQKNGKWQCTVCGDWNGLYFEECQSCGAAEGESYFSYLMRDGQFWLRCRVCGTEFRPSKTLNCIHLTEDTKE